MRIGEGGAGPGQPGQRWWFWPTVVATFLAVFVGAPVAVFEILAGPSRADVAHGADALKLPPEFTLVQERWSGSRACLDDCLRLLRLYSSPLSKEATFQAFATALTGAGHHCISFCKGFGDEGIGWISTWPASKGIVTLLVYSTDDPAHTADRPPDPTRNVYVHLVIG